MIGGRHDGMTANLKAGDADIWCIFHFSNKYINIYDFNIANIYYFMKNNCNEYFF